MITKDMQIEELLRKYPKSIRFFMQKGIKVITCGEPVWDTIEGIAKKHNYNPDDFIKEIKEYLKSQGIEVE